MSVHEQSGDAVFLDACNQLRAARLRPELLVTEIPAPSGTAQHAIAFSAGVKHGLSDDVFEGGDSPFGAGRLVLMYDPDSAEYWGGSFRVVCFAQAPLEIDMGTDPFLAEVAWSWLVDALALRNAEYSYASGTATKTLSTGFGSLASQGDAAQIEIRASWTPLGSDFGAHAEAWGELLCLLAGLPQHEGVASLGAKRAERSYGHGA